MVHPVGPGLTIRLVALDRPNVVRLAIIVPCQDLDDVELVPGVKDGFPALGVQMLIRQKDEL